MNPGRPEVLAKFLLSWDLLNRVLGELTLEEVAFLLQLEAQKRNRRVEFLKRLLGRYRRLRGPRELNELISKGTVPWLLDLSP